MIKQLEYQIQLYHQRIRQQQIENYKRQKRQSLLQNISSHPNHTHTGMN